MSSALSTTSHDVADRAVLGARPKTPTASMLLGGADAVEQRSVEAFLATYPASKGAPLAVVIAAYDEEDTVGEVVRAVPRTIAGLQRDVIVVVDGARDATATIAAKAGALVCDIPLNRGQGAALRVGYQLARARGAEVIATLDADGQYDPAELERVVAPIAAGDADFVTGSRRLGHELTTDPIRHAGVVFFAAVIGALVRQRVTDPACGLRAMSADVASAVTLLEPQYQASELLIGAALAGYRVLEVPATMHRRTAGNTKKGGNAAYGMRFARVVLLTWWRERRRRPLPSPLSAKMTSS